MRRSRSRAPPPDFDGVRRRYLAQLYELTERPVILYSTDWLGGGPPEAAINLEDMQAMMEVCRGLPGPDLDLILHSPGGSAEAAASIVHYLRTRYKHIRAFVPVAAMSAATMWALACDEVVMGKHSQLGPIDPQLVTPQGSIPARAILDQFGQSGSVPRIPPSWEHGCRSSSSTAPHSSSNVRMRRSSRSASRRCG
jgi:hypothetical protein